MRHSVFWVITLILINGALAQDKRQTNADASDREALLKAAIARDRGEISALEPSAGEVQGVIIGYSSGAVLHCYGTQSCMEFGGTPHANVEHIAISSQEGAEVIWVSYAQGALYKCTGVTCRKFVWDGEQPR